MVSPSHKISAFSLEAGRTGTGVAAAGDFIQDTHKTPVPLGFS
jgi:hypothetical protein